MIVLYFLCICEFFFPSYTSVEPFIAGGRYAKIEQFPHSVYLFITCSNQQETCGGSILTQHVVLTAAHCFDDCIRQFDIVAYAGSANIEEMTIADRIHSFRIHDHYNMKTITNDIALGSTKSAWPLGTTIKRVIIERNFPGVKMAQIAGWGVINDVTMQQTEKLKMVSQIIHPTATCQDFIRTFEAGMMCAQNNMKNYPSHGDSGSALISGNGQQIGVVSFRSLKKTELVVYTNVSHYYDWIGTHARQLHCFAKK